MITIFVGQEIIVSEELLSAGREMLRKALGYAVSEPLHNLKTGTVINKGNKIRDFAQDILINFDQNPKLYCSKTGSLMDKVLKHV